MTRAGSGAVAAVVVMRKPITRRRAGEEPTRARPCPAFERRIGRVSPSPAGGRGSRPARSAGRVRAIPIGRGASHHPSPRPSPASGRGSSIVAPGIVAGAVVAIGLRRVAVDERARIERVAHAAHLVLDGEERAPALDVDDLLEAVLVLIARLADEAALQKPAIGAGEVGDIDLEMVSVVGGDG